MFRKYKLSFILIAFVLATSVGKAVDSGDLFKPFESKEYGLQAVIPANWELYQNQQKDTLRLEMHESPTSFIIIESYRGFQGDLYTLQQEILRKQKLRFHTLEKIIDKYPTKPVSDTKSEDSSFLMVTRFYHQGQNYIQRLVGKKVANNAVVVNFVAAESKYYRFESIMNQVAAGVKIKAFTPEQLDANRKQPSTDSTDQIDKDLADQKKGHQPDPPNGKPATDLKLDTSKENTQPGDNNGTTKMDKDANVQLEYTYLEDGNWRYCTRQQITKNQEKYEAKTFGDGAKGFCLKE